MAHISWEYHCGHNINSLKSTWAVLYLIFGIEVNVEKGDMVFFKCSNPAVGIVKRIAKDKSWAEVNWIDIDRIVTKAHRCPVKHLELLNPVLNYWNVQIGITKKSHFNLVPEQYVEPVVEKKEECCD